MTTAYELIRNSNRDLKVSVGQYIAQPTDDFTAYTGGENYIAVKLPTDTYSNSTSIMYVYLTSDGRVLVRSSRRRTLDLLPSIESPSRAMKQYYCEELKLKVRVVRGHLIVFVNEGDLAEYKKDIVTVQCLNGVIKDDQDLTPEDKKIILDSVRG